jgi:hypothetical protein
MKSVSTVMFLCGEQRAEPLAGHRLGERTVERGDEDDLRGLAHALALEVVIREEDELQRRHRALDGQLGDVHDQPATGERVELCPQRDRTLEGVELTDLAVPLLAEHPGGLVGAGGRAAGDDELVVVQGASADEVHGGGWGVDPFDLGHDDLDVVVQVGALALADLARLVHPERDEQVPRLVVVDVVLVDDGDGPFGGREPLAELVDDHRPGRARSQDHEVLRGGGHTSTIPLWV